jgi:protein-tyrosine-phosphatase
MIIHFVCEGNTYRSRLAGAYLDSKRIPQVKAMSSGIRASRNLSGIITWESQRIIQKENLIEFENHAWHETTKELLDEANLVIFMQPKYYEFCKDNFGFSGNYKILNVNDLSDYGFVENYVSLEDDIERIKVSEKTYTEIKEKVDNLVKELGY